MTRSCPDWADDGHTTIPCRRSPSFVDSSVDNAAPSSSCCRLRPPQVTDGRSSADLPTGLLEKILDGEHVRITIKEMDVIASVLETSLFSLLAPVGDVGSGAAAKQAKSDVSTT